MASSTVEKDNLNSSDDDSGEDLEGLEDFSPPETRELWKEDTYILVVGHTGVGKSSLINALFGMEVAIVTDSVTPTDHDPAEHHLLEADGKRIHIFDTRGFGDMTRKEKELFEKIKKTQSTFDLVLFCHKLYDKVDKATEEEMQLMAREMGNTLLERSIFVFTFGDEYKIRCKIYKNRKQIPEAKQQIKAKMIQIADFLIQELRKTLSLPSTDKDVISTIPYCIVSADVKKLPTSDNWTDDLWKLCEERISDEAKPFMTWYMKHHRQVNIVAGGVASTVIVGTAAGVTLGAIGGTIGFPGIGTAVGAAVGGVAGAIGGGIVGVTVGGVTGGVASEIVMQESKKKSEQRKQSEDDISQAIG